MTESSFADFLKSRGYTTCGFARKTGIRKSQVSEYRRGLHHPTRRTLNRISLALGIPLVDLLDQIPVREKHQNHPTPPVFCITCGRKLYKLPRTTEGYDTHVETQTQ